MSGFEVLNLSHVWYPVTDMDKSIRFFTEALGFYFQRKADVHRGQRTIHEGYVGFGDVLVNMILIEDGSTLFPDLGQRPYEFGLAVTDIEAAIEHLESFGATVARPIWSGQTFWGRQVVLNVPGGAPIALREWRAPDGPHFQAWNPGEQMWAAGRAQ